MTPRSDPPPPSEFNTVRGILFDLGNTLIYFSGDWDAALAESANELANRLESAGLHLNRTAFLHEFRRRLQNYYTDREQDYIEHTTTSLLRNLLADWGYADFPEDAVRQALAGMYAVTQRLWEPEADAHSTLQALQASNYRLGLISNAGDDADVQVLVDKAGLRPYLDFILTSAAQGIRKPHPAIFHHALDLWGYAPEEAVMVGDTLEADILGAHNTGMPAIWITRRTSSSTNQSFPPGLQPEATVTTLKELLSLF